MKRVLLPFLMSAFGTVSVVAQINTETFESNPNFISIASGGLGFTVTNTGGAFITGSTGAGARPASTPYASSGTNAYAISNATGEITSGDISTIGASFVALRFRLMAVSLNSTNGLDGGDDVLVSISPDGGTTWYSTLEVSGNANARWSYSSGTGTAQTNYDGNNTPVVVAPAGGGDRTTDGYSTVIVRNLPINITNLRVRITMDVDDNERWVIDQVQILRTAGGPLPVNFANVQTSLQNGNATVKWSNLTESDINYYAVERSFDGKNFEYAGKVAPRANDYSRQDYSYTETAAAATVFYRVKAVEFNGSSKSTLVMRVSTVAKSGFSVYPNPVQNKVIALQGRNIGAGTYNVQLFAANGQQVMSRNLVLPAGFVNQAIELPGNIQPGTYQLRVLGGSGTTSMMLIVQ